ncbi:MAG: hypothetical protein SPL30_06430 [Succinivibrio sp.]|nr:hypothetical protein [Succinivibrio sp.]
MARTKKNIAANTAISTRIITDAATEKEKAAVTKAKAGSDLTYVACGLPLGIVFDDVSNGQGGYKRVSFPGVNHALSGKTTGILLGRGNAVLVAVAKADWQDIVRKHGKERAFTALPPLLMEVPGGESEFKARHDEISAMDNGTAPVDAASVGVEKAKASE